MDAPNYLSWFTKLFLPAVAHLTKTAPVFLIQDGHHSHISLELIRRAGDNNIVILCLPPNTTHLLQPFDIAVFAPIKKEWKKILKQYKLETKGQKVSKEVFPSLLSKLWDSSLKPSHCRADLEEQVLFHTQGSMFWRSYILQQQWQQRRQPLHAPNVDMKWLQLLLSRVELFLTLLGFWKSGKMVLKWERGITWRSEWKGRPSHLMNSNSSWKKRLPAKKHRGNLQRKGKNNPLMRMVCYKCYLMYIIIRRNFFYNIL